MSKTMTKLEAFSVPVSTIFLDYTTDKIPYQNLHKNFWPFPYVTASSLFAFMSAAAHGLVLANFDIYESQLRRGLNHFRWIEYAFSSSLIITLISMLFGIWDFFSLIVIFCINGSMCLFGDIHERVNAGREPQVQIFSFILLLVTNFAPNYIWLRLELNASVGQYGSSTLSSKVIIDLYHFYKCNQVQAHTQYRRELDCYL